MNLEYDIDPSRPTGIAITIDMTKPVIVNASTPADICRALSLTSEQLDFARMSTVPREMIGTYTSVYYGFGCIRVRDVIISSAAEVLSRNLVDYQAIAKDEEDSINRIFRQATVARDIAHYAPMGHVVTLAVPIAPSNPLLKSDLREVVQVHLVPKVGKKFLQYRAASNNAYSLFARLKAISPYIGGNVTVRVGNTPTRTFLA